MLHPCRHLACMSRAAEDVAIGCAEAHVWVAAPRDLERTGHLSGYLAILSPAERQRMQRFCFDRDRLVFLAAHGLARTALSACAPSVPPEAWEFAHTERGRPEVAAPQAAPILRFNISHTSGLVACVVTALTDCGIDVEMVGRPTGFDRLAGRVLSQAEQTRLKAAPAHAQPELFFGYWTLKEAYLKARACGISVPLDECAFEFRPEGIRLQLEGALDDDVTDWQFAQWSPTTEHVLAVALRNGGPDAHQIICHPPPPLPRGV
jgi:4'-phosphopantetheinyl transferase